MCEGKRKVFSAIERFRNYIIYVLFLKKVICISTPDKQKTKENNKKWQDMEYKKLQQAKKPVKV